MLSVENVEKADPSAPIELPDAEWLYRYLRAYPQIDKSGLTIKTRCCQVKYHCIIQTVGKCRGRVCSWLTDPSFLRAQLALLDSAWHGLGLQSICGLGRSSRLAFLGLDNSISPCIGVRYYFIVGVLLPGCCLCTGWWQARTRRAWTIFTSGSPCVLIGGSGHCFPLVSCAVSHNSHWSIPIGLCISSGFRWLLSLLWWNPSSFLGIGPRCT